MGIHKLILDDGYSDDFLLIAIHCSEEAYKVAYLLNQFVHLRLQRDSIDLLFTNNGLDRTYAIFEYKDQNNYTDYYLVANKCKTTQAKIASSGGLFGNIASEETITNYLIPELNKVDYFLKIQSDFDKVGTRVLITAMNEIKQLISAYEVDIETLKSKNNLIFD